MSDYEDRVVYTSVGCKVGGIGVVKSYLIDERVNIRIGDRVIVPTSIKDGNVEDIAIAEVMELHDRLRDEAHLPVMSIVDFAMLAHVPTVVRKIAEKRAAAAVKA